MEKDTVFVETSAAASDFESEDTRVVRASDGRLSRINPNTGEVSTVAVGQLGSQGSKGYPPTWIFNGVAVDPSGAIYVTGGIANVFYRVEP
ncbi:MAG: hypothetical protein ACNYWM_05475 [Methanosarcinales archaeon]